MKNGNKLADWFIRKSKKSKPLEIKKLISNTLLEKSSIIVKRLFSHGVKLAIDITKISVYAKNKSKFIPMVKLKKEPHLFINFLDF